MPYNSEPSLLLQGLSPSIHPKWPSMTTLWDWMSTLRKDLFYGAGGFNSRHHSGTSMDATTFPINFLVQRWYPAIGQPNHPNRQPSQGRTHRSREFHFHRKPWVSSTSGNTPEIPGIPGCVQLATKLSPHRPWDCTIDYRHIDYMSHLKPCFTMYSETSAS